MTKKEKPKLKILEPRAEMWGQLNISPLEINALRKSRFYYRKMYTGEYDAIRDNQDEILAEVRRLEKLAYRGFIDKIKEQMIISSYGMDSHTETIEVITDTPVLKLNDYKEPFTAFVTKENIVYYEIDSRMKERKSKIAIALHKQIPKSSRFGQEWIRRGFFGIDRTTCLGCPAVRFTFGVTYL